MFAELNARFPPKDKRFQVFAHPDCLLHDPGYGHPEKPDRLENILKGLLALDGNTPIALQIPSPAAVADLEIVHPREYLIYLEEQCHLQASAFMSPDNLICEDTFKSVLASGGLALELARHMAQGGSGFALTRPPGHHAHRDRAEGFCYINHVALAIETLRKDHPAARFLVVDIDVHHGNGIESLYRNDKNAFYFSIHGSPAHIYPGTGWEIKPDSQGGGGNLCNVTLDLHTRGDVWLEKFSANLETCLRFFEPDFLLVSVGFDAHAEDPFGLMELQDADYFKCMGLLVDIAQTHCKDRIGLFLEGGYSSEVMFRLAPRLIAQLSARYN